MAQGQSLLATSSVSSSSKTPTKHMQKVQMANANCIPVRHCQSAGELSPFSTGVYAGADRRVPFEDELVDDLVEGLEEELGGIPSSSASRTQQQIHDKAHESDSRSTQ